jgi:hypothetical protein
MISQNRLTKREQERMTDMVFMDFGNIQDSLGKITGNDTERDENHLNYFKSNPVKARQDLRKKKTSKSKSKRKK